MVTRASVTNGGIGQKRSTSNLSAVAGTTSQGATAKAGAGGGKKGTTSSPSGGKKGTTSIPSTAKVATPEGAAPSASLGKAGHGKKGTTSSPSTVEMADDQPTKKKKSSVKKTKQKGISSLAKAGGGKKGAVSNFMINVYLFYELYYLNYDFIYV
jgi:hypothetical protein